MKYDVETLCQWYEEVLGAEGHTQVKAESSVGKPLGAFFSRENYSDMLAWIESHNQKSMNAYFTLENYTEFDKSRPTYRVERFHTSTAGRRCFVVDFDLKHSEFDSTKELLEFLIVALEYQPHSFVLSGGGVHVYYALDRVVTLEEYKAFWIHTRRLFEGTKAPADMAFKGGHSDRSLIRCPQTINWKTDYAPNYPTGMLIYNGGFYSPEDLLPEQTYTPPLSDFFNGQDRPDRFIEGLQVSPIIPVPAVEVSMEDVVAGCPAAARYYEMSLEGFRDDRDDVVGDRQDVVMFANLCHHTVHEYGEESNRMKEFIKTSVRFPESTKEWLRANIWDSFHEGSTMDKPWGCHKWGTGMSPACLDCPHNTKKQFSPWKAGREEFLKRPIGVKFVAEEANALADNFSKEKPAAGLIFGDSADGVYFIDNPDSPFMSQLKVIYKYDDENNERKLLVETQGTRRKVFYKSFASPGATATELCRIGVSVSNAKFAQRYMTWSHDTAIFKEVHSGFGWKGKKFITPFKVVGTGELPDFMWSPEENEERYGVGPIGTSKLWTETMLGWDDEAFVAHQALIMSSFAAPLLELLEGAVSTLGFTVNIFSKDSGAGKSLALRCAQSVFWSPKHWSNRSSDTQRSHWDKVRIMKNLPVTWDEVTVASPEHIMETIFYVSNGRSRERMETTDAKRYMTDSFRTFLLVSSNIPLQHLIGKSTQNTNEAAYYRTVDLKARRLEWKDARRLPLEKIEKLMASEGTYGQIGEDYLSYCIANKVNLHKIAGDLKKNLDNKHNSDRFVTEWAALIMTAALALENMGLMPFSKGPLFDYLNKRVEESRGRALKQVKQSVPTPDEMLSKYCSRIIWITKGMPQSKELTEYESFNREVYNFIRGSSSTSRLGMSVIYKTYNSKNRRFTYHVPLSFLRDAYTNYKDILSVWNTTGIKSKRRTLNGTRTKVFMFETTADFTENL